MKSRITQYIFIALVLIAITGGYFYYQSKASETLRGGTNGTAGKTKKINISQTSKLTNELVGYWTFNGTDTTATTATDKSTAGKNGTLSGGPTPAIGKVGQALDFDGSNDTMTFANITLTSTHTVSMWIYPKTATLNSGVLFTQNESNGIYYRGSAAGANARKIDFYYSGADHHNSTPLADQAWSHVVIVNNAGAVTFYINGQADGTAVGAPGYAASRLGNDSGNSLFKGKIDEARVYSRALSQSEITELYQQGQTKINASQTSKLTNELVGHWTFDGADAAWTSPTAGTVTNRGSLGGTGTLINMSQSTTPTIGKVGQALDFDGSNDTMTFANITLTSTHTVSMWIYPKTLTLDSGVLLTQNESNGIYYRGSAAGANARKLDFAYSGADHYNNTPLADQAWSHVVIVNNAGTVTFYINGQADGTAVGAPGYGSNRLGNDSSNNLFKGKIDETRIYSRALSQSEVTELYNQGR